MDGFANVMQWHDWWWALEHCIDGYVVSVTHYMYKPQAYIVAKPPVTAKPAVYGIKMLYKTKHVFACKVVAQLLIM